jgi:tetratricopeptide (TPR) repeat protein
MAARRVTDVDRRPAIGQRQPAIHAADPVSKLTSANAGPYIRDNPTRTTNMRSSSSNSTAIRNLLTYAAFAWLLSSLLYLASGCASGSSNGARNDAALNSYVQGVRAYQSGDTDKAVTELKDAVNKNNDLVMARSMLGDIYRARSNYDAAREQYEVVARLDPYEFSNHYRLGLAYQLLDRLRDAAASYLKALNLKPTDANTNMYLGTVYLQLNEPKEALKYAERAVQYDPKSADAWVKFGLILDLNVEYPRAEEAYRKSLDLDSDNEVTRLYLGENLLSQKKYDQARSVFQELVKVQDAPLNRKRLGDAYAGEKNFTEAINQYRAALKLDSNYYPALNEIGATYIADYEKGLTLDDTKRKAALDAWQQSLAINRAQARIMALMQKYSKAPMFQP